MTEYLHDVEYYTLADIVNTLVIPQQGFDEFLIHDERKDDLTLRHKELLKKMKIKYENNQNFFLFLHYSNIHTNIKKNVLKKFNNFSNDYFKNKNVY